MIKASVVWLLRVMRLEQLGVLYGYLRRVGWIRSLRGKKPVDSGGNPLPWYSYPAIKLIDDRLKQCDTRAMRVFEFGSGNSTLWWAARVGYVDAVEDDARWYETIRMALPENVSYLYRQERAQYVGRLTESSHKYHVIVVDGSHRNECLSACADQLERNGVIVVDNSDWEWLAPQLSNLARRGFKQLPLYGLGAVNGCAWETSVFYRDGNWMGL